MYVAAKGGEKAIENAHRLLAHERRGDPSVPELSLDQIKGQLRLAVDRVMCEGSLYDRELAALAIKQACGDLIEAIFLLRAFRATLPRFGASEPLDTGEMAVRRRISAAFKDLPGGQVLGPTFDYTHRLLDPTLQGAGASEPGCAEPIGAMPRVIDILSAEGLIEPSPRARPDDRVGDLQRLDGHKIPSVFRPIAIFACRIWRAATKDFCWRWAIRPSADMAELTPLRARSGSVRSRSSSCRRSSVFASRLEKSPSPNAR